MRTWSSRQVLQRVEQAAAVVVDRADRRELEELRKRLLHELPILQHVRHAGRAAQIVFEHVVLAVAVANQVGARDVAPDAARRIEADALLAEAGGGGDDVLGNDAVANNLLIVVDVVDEQVERGDPLLAGRARAIPIPFAE